MQELIKYIQKAVLSISEALKFPDTSYSNEHNKTGDTQLKFDILSDEIITKTLSECSEIKALISEEKDEILQINKNAKFVVAYDPLDGSSLFDVNFSVGSIFAIYENEASSSNLKAALYSIYGGRLEMVICVDTPKLYRLNKNGEFDFVKALKLESKGKILAPGGTQKNWLEKHAKFIKNMFDSGYRLRYSGAMVSDIHQILCKGGGLFSYPATSDAPNGKLRVFFEVLPMAFIVERGGGASSDGVSKTLLDIKATQTHATTPCFFGSKFEIDALLKAYNE